MNLVQCKKCNHVHREISEQEAICQLTLFNNFFYDSSSEVRSYYGNRPGFIENFMFCMYCGESHKEFSQATVSFIGTVNPILDKNVNITTDRYVDNAAANIQLFCNKWGRLGGQAKEKYNTVRFYAIFGWLSLHTLVYPGYVYIKFPKWLRWLDDNLITQLLNPFERLFIKWQEFVYRKAYKRAIDKYPHIRYNIINSADRSDLLEGL